jgi:alcohol dehydrogenase class IV
MLSTRPEEAMALITYLTRIQFDFGAIKLLDSELQLIGMRRPLVITDKGVIAAGLWDKVKAQLPGNMPVALYDGTPENPTEQAVREALAIYKAEGCDGIIAIGGGSPMDLGKAVALMATHPGDSLQPYAMVEGGAAKITSKVAPVVAIPTTSGTGSEVGRGGLIIMDSGRKLAIGSPHLIPRLALVDPELTLGLPPRLTAGTGMDAIAHCMETFMAPTVNPPAEAIALDGLGKAWRHLERAVRDGGDREARWNMAMAAMEGAMCFQKGLGAVHALSHPSGALKGLPLHHGTLNAVYMPAVIRYNAPAVGDKIARMAQVIGLPEREATADGLAEAVAGMNARIGIPTGLKAMGVPENAFPLIAEGALGDHCHLTTPRQPTKAEYITLIEQSYGA